MEMAKKKPRGHNIGGTYKQKRRKEKKGKSQISGESWVMKEEGQVYGIFYQYFSALLVVS